MSGNHPAHAAAIIPVRLDSQRLPGKAMLQESGRPLFLHTWDRAIAAGCFDGGVVVATDSDEVATAAERARARVIRTSPTPRTGSERCAEAVHAIVPAVGLIVDIQGDWPEVDPRDLSSLVDCLRGDPDLPSATLATPLDDDALAGDPNVVKVVRDRAGDAMYFSRACIPYDRSGARTADRPDRSPTDSAAQSRLRHIGVYAFTREMLVSIPDLPSSGLDEVEGLEQLRFLENGFAMRVLDATGAPWGIECRSDYDAFLERLPRTDDRS